MRLSQPLLVVGYGQMGSALVKGWVRAGVDPNLIYVVDPKSVFLDDVQGMASLAELPDKFFPQAIVMAVKPQMVEKILPTYTKLAQDSVMFSIVAGTRISVFEKYLGDVAVVRSMPNTPAAIGAGMVVACGNKNMRDEHRALFDDLFASTGQVAWVRDEKDMDAVTAVSGSGPAYVFYLTECLARAGEQAGLSKDLAMQLARQTVIGSGALMAQDLSNVADLRAAVTSPGGTTAAALEVLMAPAGLQDVMERAILAAKKRSEEL